MVLCRLEISVEDRQADYNSVQGCGGFAGGEKTQLPGVSQVQSGNW